MLPKHLLPTRQRQTTYRKKTVVKLKKIGFTVLPHPPYSPDLTPSDYYLFSPLKSAIRGKVYSSVEEIHNDIEAWIASKPIQFFTDGINKLARRWQKRIDHDGDYFKHILHDTVY